MARARSALRLPAIALALVLASCGGDSRTAKSAAKGKSSHASRHDTVAASNIEGSYQCTLRLAPTAGAAATESKSACRIVDEAGAKSFALEDAALRIEGTLEVRGNGFAVTASTAAGELRFEAFDQGPGRYAAVVLLPDKRLAELEMVRSTPSS